MTIDEVKTMLESITGFGTKVVYYQWPENGAPALPYICFFETGISPFSADGINYYNAKHISIELYTQMRDTASETLIETKLKAKNIFYSKEQTYLYDEKCYETIYEIEV